MNRLLIVALLAGVSLAASAQDVPHQTAANDGVPASDQRAPADDAYCLRETGSLIVSARNTARAQRADRKGEAGRTNCAAIGRAYTRDDIDRTGEPNLSDALRKLDPSIH